MTKHQTTQEPRYKLCTTNCSHYSLINDDDNCDKGNFAFQPPLGERCTFSLLEGEAEHAQTRAKCTQPEPARSWVYSRGKETEVQPGQRTLNQKLMDRLPGAYNPTVGF